MGRFVVPFGTEPSDYEFTKGIIIVYDTFDDSEEELVNKAVELAETRNFDKVILYPLHEKTGRRMDIEVLSGYRQKVKILEDIISHLNTDITVEICKLEGKRSKYTPIDTTLSFISEFHKGPYFLMMPDFIANKFATYSSYDKWIREVRLMIHKKENESLHSKIKNKEKRWEWV